MLFPLLVFAQLSAATDPAYSSDRVRDLVARAVAANRALRRSSWLPRRVESEFSLTIRDTLGRESAGQIEQIASRVSWTRDGNTTCTSSATARKASARRSPP